MNFDASSVFIDVPDNSSKPFPVGMELLSYLFENAMSCYMMSSEENYPLLLSLFLSALTPYLHFASHWIFYGQSRDQHGEFGIRPGLLLFSVSTLNPVLIRRRGPLYAASFTCI